MSIIKHSYFDNAETYDEEGEGLPRNVGRVDVTPDSRIEVWETEVGSHFCLIENDEQSWHKTLPFSLSLSEAMAYAVGIRLGLKVPDEVMM